MTALSLGMYSRPLSTRRAQLYLILHTIGLISSSSPNVPPQAMEREIYVIEPTDIHHPRRVEAQAQMTKGQQKGQGCSPNCNKIWKTIGLITGLVVIGLAIHVLFNHVLHMNRT